MAEQEVEVVIDEGDADMADPDGEATAAAADEDGEATGLEDIEPEVTAPVTFLDYLRSPIVELAIGPSLTTLYAHQALLTQSPHLADLCAAFTTTDTLTARRIELPNDDLAACASVLEYLYKADYFPTLTNQTMEYDPTVPQPDNGGVALLRHARIYTLAKRFALPQLAQLAHRKIHLTQSTAQGEIAYARFVYAETQADDAIRRPVAQFWATRSHVLRHQAEQEFRQMCLEYPQFGFDVLSLVLDAQEKRSQREGGASSTQGTGGGPGRKRQRVSGV